MLDTKNLGRTGLQVSRIGIGTAALGRPAYMNRGRDLDFPEGRSVQEMAMRTFSVLDVAREAGIRYVDTARSYGQGEGFVADWLQRSGSEPGDVTVGSKWGYTYCGGWRMDAPVQETKSHDLDTLSRQWEASRKVLWSYLDLYQVHSVTVDSPLFDDAPLLARLALLKAEFGVSIGATVSGAQQADALRRLMEVEVDGLGLFDSVQATWNPMEPSVGPALAEAHRAGWGVIVKEPLANGRLAPGRHDDQVRGLARAAAEREVGLDAVVLAAALAQPWADVVLSGAVTGHQLRSNLAAIDIDLDQELRLLLEGLARPAAAYWSERAQLPWG
jgi:aryl-alcohol dehydrogenase-like predicted oxidoreductase